MHRMRMCSPARNYFQCLKTVVIICYSLNISARAITQIPDSLAQKDYNYFIEKLDSDSNSPVLDAVYSRSYLTKALAEQDWKHATLAYKNLLYKSDKSIRLAYADSMIMTARKTKDKSIEAHAHVTKGATYYTLNRYGDAIEEYVTANKLAAGTGDQYYTFQVKYLMAQAKYYLGYYDEALALSRECVDYYQKDGGKPFLNSLYTLGICYQRLGKLELCSATNSLGIKEATDTEDYDMLDYFGYSEGVNQYRKGNYKVSIDKLNIIAPKFEKKGDTSNKSILDFYLAKNYIALGQMDNALPYLFKVDEAFKNGALLKPDHREAYEILIKYYRDKGDKEKQLYFINQLIEVDKYLFDNFQHLSSKLRKEYNTGSLLAAKKELEQAAQREKILHGILIVSGILISIVSTVFLFRKIRKRIAKRRKMANLQKRLSNKPNVVELSALEMNPEIEGSILAYLEQFESSGKYLEKDITLARLAELSGSNTVYVSKVINHYKGCKVNEYVNDLKIYRVIALLKEERKFRGYTNKALAEEVGFNSTQSFVKAFEKKVGMSLGEFVDALKGGNI
jgi:AraC-like DNA-binding protein